MFFFTTAGSAEWNSQTLPQPQNTTPASANCFFTSFRSIGRQRRLDLVRVRGAALDRRDADLLAHLQERRQVPVFRHVVGDDAELELRDVVGLGER